MFGSSAQAELDTQFRMEKKHQIHEFVQYSYLFDIDFIFCETEGIQNSKSSRSLMLSFSFAFFASATSIALIQGVSLQPNDLQALQEIFAAAGCDTDCKLPNVNADCPTDVQPDGGRISCYSTGHLRYLEIDGPYEDSPKGSLSSALYTHQ